MSHGKPVGHNLTVELPQVQQPCPFSSVAPVSVHEALPGEPLRHLGVDLPDLLVAVVAGHDLGHGPFSHLWEEFSRRAGSSWDHEASSLQLLDLLLEKNNIKLEDYGLSPLDLVFIKELIDGLWTRPGLATLTKDGDQRNTSSTRSSATS